MASTPAWQDSIISVASIAYASFTVKTGGTTIYSGKVFSKDSVNGGIEIRINDICADYMRSQLPKRTLTYDSSGVPYIPFTVEVTKPNSQVLQYITNLSPDWSYDRSRSITPAFNSIPVRKVFFAGQTLFIGFGITPSTITGTITDDDGTTHTISISQTPTTWNGKFDSSFLATNAKVIESGTLAINLGSYTNAKTVLINSGSSSITWTREDNNGRFILHYINAYGGWDSLPMASGVITDNYTRSTASRQFDNSESSARGTSNFANTIKRKFQLHTGYINDNGVLMHHLVGSTCVYLQDLEDGSRIYPVTIADTSCEYKTYRNQGGKMVDYTVNCELAQSMIRL